MVRDPVCQMEVDENQAVTTEWAGQVVHFCSEGCRDRFLAGHPDKGPRRSYELIIIGGGPAGLTAGVYAAKLKLEAFVIFKDLGGQAIDSTKIENYMGFHFITGPELVEKFSDQVLRSNYVDHKNDEVERIEAGDEEFRVTTSDLQTYRAKAVIVAAGMTRRTLGVWGEEAFQRKGVFYGNLQDLSFVQGKNAIVVGGGNSAVQILDNLHTVAAKIFVVAERFEADPTVLARSAGFEAAAKYEGWKVDRLEGDRGGLQRVVIRKPGSAETQTLDAAGLFIAIGLRPNAGLVSEMTPLNDRGEIIIERDCSTAVAGLFAAGDVTDAYGKRIVIASGEGAKAAMAARQHILALRRNRAPTG